MHKAKIAISLDEKTLGRLVRQRVYPSRSCAIQEAGVLLFCFFIINHYDIIV